MIIPYVVLSSYATPSYKFKYWIIIKMKLEQFLLRQRCITTKIVKEINRSRKAIYAGDEMTSGPFFWNFCDEVQYFHIRPVL